jgi:hypothetical protein
MSISLTRRQFIAGTAAALFAPAWAGPLGAQGGKPLFRISLAQWSLHRTSARAS